MVVDASPRPYLPSTLIIAISGSARKKLRLGRNSRRTGMDIGGERELPFGYTLRLSVIEFIREIRGITQKLDAGFSFFRELLTGALLYSEIINIIIYYYSCSSLQAHASDFLALMYKMLRTDDITDREYYALIAITLCELGEFLFSIHPQLETEANFKAILH